MTAVAAAIARLYRRPESAAEPPAWLLPHQVLPFRQAVAAIDRYGGVLMALPIGTGKTYVGLAVGARLATGDPLEVIGPAVLRSHWHRTAASLGIPIRFTSFEQASRGDAPAGGGPVVIDECHRLRHPETRRYRTIAPALVGRPVVLLSATPMVNRAADLAAQLLLGIRDDALDADGVPSIARHLASGIVTPPFAALVVTGAASQGPAPGRQDREIDDWSAGDRNVPRLTRAIDRLRLARDGPVARLLRVSLFRALASSPAALLASLGRYDRLLDHAAAAHRAGHPVSRALIQSVTGVDPEQLVLWEVLTPERLTADLALGDRRSLAALTRVLRASFTESDPKLDRLRRIVADGRPTVLFTTSVDTLHYLRRQSLGVSVAWVTGSAAGMGWMRASRAAVLDAFDPVTARPGIRPPTLLLASDVAAEGLNLRRAGRIIHYDLPWTAVRVDQRDGRAIRLGSVHTTVEVVTFRIPALLENRIGLESAVARKRALFGDGMALGESGPATGPVSPGVAVVKGPDAAVAGFAVSDGTGPARGLVLVQWGRGEWSEDPALADRLFHLAGTGVPFEVAGGEVEEIRAGLERAVDAWLCRRNAERFPTDPIGAGVLHAIEARIKAAGRRRSHEAVLEAEGVLRFLGRGHTAGERMMVARLSANETGAFAEASRMGREDGGPVAASLVGLLIFREGGGPTNLSG